MVATVRSEFLSANPNRAGLADAIDGTVIVEPLSRARLPEVIEQPARRAGLQFPADLVARMVDDTVDGDALPLLARTLEQLYRRVGSGGKVTVAYYESLGGVAGYVRREADRLNSECHRQGLGRHVLPTLLKLTNLDASGLPTRRRIDRAALTPEEDAIAQAFIKARLRTSTTSENRVRVEVAHEVLLQQWTPLSEAIEASSQALRAVGARASVERLVAQRGPGRHADGDSGADGERCERRAR